MTEIDTSKPHPARVYDWFLGGKDNYPVDEAVGRRMMSIDGRAKHSAQTNRWFMHRATRWLAGEAGVRQFLDIGTGIPTEPNLHQLAQAAAPDARVVYADNDPIVLAHAAALLRGTPEGITEYIQADARQPGAIIEQAKAVLDFGQPVALSLIALTHFIGDDDGAYELVDELVGALPPGSFLALAQLTGDYDPEAIRRAVDLYGAGGVNLVPRSRAGVSRFFEGLDLVDPGLVPVAEWHPELAVDEVDDGQLVPLYAAVGRKA
ncbi:SAM-dependent methyltransferase [Streptomyces sp. NPDC050738]|uniref:SAM-dependent methyltransferase n=1 Tax=Streptomyces sp. NPDC050738 TaxID=3154744 RepID=UPI00343A5FFB